MTDEICPLLHEYIDMVKDVESPLLYHRWAMLTAVGALLSRRVRFELPFGKIYPNQYVILLGDPATRKSTAIKIMTDILSQVGYRKIAGGRTSPEQFLADMHSGFDMLSFKREVEEADITPGGEPVLDFDIQLSGKGKISDVLIAEGELVEFLGQNNTGFSSMLTDLWDNHNHKDVRTKTGEKLRIQQPTISMLGGATSTSFKRMFPLEIIGQGLLSRFILVYAAGPRQKYFEPPPFDQTKFKEIITYLKHLVSYESWPTKFTFTRNAYDYSKFLYESSTEDLSDPRFAYYNGRRDTHYRKLCLVIAAANFHHIVEETDCFLANTILSYTEKFMPAALGEFGFDKQGEQVELVYSVVAKNPSGITMQDLVSKTTAIVHNISELATVLLKLQAGQRIDRIASGAVIRYIAVARTIQASSELVNYNLLQEYRENPTFGVNMDSMEGKLAEYELSQELELLNRQAGSPMSGKRGPGRPRKQEVIFGGNGHPPEAATPEASDFNFNFNFPN